MDANTPDMINRLIYVDDYEDHHGKRDKKRPKTYMRNVIKDGKIVKTDIGSRIVTIAYQWNRDASGKNIMYGASIFHKEKESDVFVKSHHRHTAMERLRVRPKAVRFESSSTTTYQDLRNFLRQCVHRHGVGSQVRMESVKATSDQPERTKAILLNGSGKVCIGRNSFNAEELRKLLEAMNKVSHPSEKRDTYEERSSDYGRNDYSHKESTRKN